MRSRKSDDLHADILEGHYSAALCHLANDSYRLGQSASFDASPAPLDEGGYGADAFARMKDHLANDNGIALAGRSIQMGRKLMIDAGRESFVDDPEADKMLTRPYRKPFVVPASIG